MLLLTLQPNERAGPNNRPRRQIVKATAIDIQIASQLEGEAGVWCAHAKSQEASYIVLKWKEEPPCVYELRGGTKEERKAAYAHLRETLKERLEMHHHEQRQARG